MRYVNIDTAVFVDVDGSEFRVKKLRPIPDYSFAFLYEVKEEDDLDEIASRAQVLGESGEPDTYKIVDYNVVDLVEARFDLANIRTLRIPQV